jgi:hypothetical protein
MSALPPKADIHRAERSVSFVPVTDVATIGPACGIRFNWQIGG